MDSSRAEVCSGEVPCLLGRRASRDSFSTWRYRCQLRYHLPLAMMVDVILFPGGRVMGKCTFKG